MVDELLQPGSHVPTAPTGNDTWISLSESHFRSKESLSSLIERSAYLQQPFSAPPSFNPEYITSLYRSRVEDALDELSSLQRNPLLLRGSINRAKKNPALQGCTANTCLPLYMWVPVELAVRRREMWLWLVGHAGDVAKHYKTASEAIGAGMPLPKAYAAALMRFEALFVCEYTDLRDRLRDAIPAYSTFRQHYRLTDRVFTHLLDTNGAFHKDRLFWILVQLTENDDEVSAYFHFDQIDQAKDKHRMPESLLHQISDMTSIEEALSAIRSHRSRPRLLNHDAAKTICQNTVTRQVCNLMTNTFLSSRENSHDVARAFEAFVSLPCPAASDEIKHNGAGQLKDLFEGITTIWTAICTHMRSELSSLLGEAAEAAEVVDKYMTIYEWPCTPDYKEWVDRHVYLVDYGAQQNLAKSSQIQSARIHLTIAAEAQQQTKAGKAAESDQTIPNFGHLNISHPVQKKAAYLEPPKKARIKTRPTTAGLVASDEQVLADPPAVEKEVATSGKIAVSSASLRLFERMFSRFGEAQGPTKWEHLIRALWEAGLAARHSGGSAVSPHERHRKGRVTVHRPNPEVEYGLYKLRGIGKRLTKHFGWDEQIFMERPKEHAASGGE